jgi:hypothetical protein
MTQETQRLFTVEASAEYLRSIGATSVTVNFVRALISSCQVPHIQMGKRFYVTRAALDAWLTRGERRVRSG